MSRSRRYGQRLMIVMDQLDKDKILKCIFVLLFCDTGKQISMWTLNDWEENQKS